METDFVPGKTILVKQKENTRKLILFSCYTIDGVKCGIWTEEGPVSE